MLIWDRVQASRTQHRLREEPARTAAPGNENPPRCFSSLKKTPLPRSGIKNIKHGIRI